MRRRLSQLTGYATRDWKKGGKPPFDPVRMLKVLVLQRFHGLSDDASEEQIFDRTSFKAFLGPCLGDAIPDAKTLWDFKQRIEQGERPEEFDTNPAVGRQKGSDARWTKKNNETHYGGADQNTVKRLKELEKEDSRLKKPVADQALDNAMLKELVEGAERSETDKGAAFARR